MDKTTAWPLALVYAALIVFASLFPFEGWRAQGLAPVEHSFPDHHAFAKRDLEFPGARAILMTQKDAVKCASFADERFWYLPIRAVVDPSLVAFVEQKIRGSQAA